MSNFIELEASYCIENFEEMLKKIKEKVINLIMKYKSKIYIIQTRNYNL